MDQINGDDHKGRAALADHGRRCVVAALGINPHSQRLLDSAARLARGLDADLRVIHIAPAKAASLYQTNLAYQIDYARSLGAHVETLHGSDVARTLVQYAQTHRAAHIVLGQSDISRWHEITRGSVVNRLLRLLAAAQAQIDVYIVTASSRFE